MTAKIAEGGSGMEKIVILGQEYKLILDENLENMNGLCDPSVKKIKICRTLFEASKGREIENKLFFAKKVLTHEIIHAYHIESGFDKLDSLCNEDLVDWYAYMLPKINETLKGVGFYWEDASV